jgi:hypothetical protein
VLKALARDNNTDFDAEYKLPKILKNYKGNEVEIVTIPAYSSIGRPAPVVETTRGSFQRSRPTEAPSSKLFDNDNHPRQPSTASRQSNASTTIPTNPPFQINYEWNRKWASVIKPGTNVVHTSMIGKRNQFGMNKSRQLILTDEPSLVYVDVSSMQVKGEVLWEKNKPPKAATVSPFLIDALLI